MGTDKPKERRALVEAINELFPRAPLNLPQDMSDEVLIVGVIEFGESFEYTHPQWQDHRSKHCVPAGCKKDWRGDGKMWGWPIKKITKVVPQRADRADVPDHVVKYTHPFQLSVSVTAVTEYPDHGQ